VLPAAAAPASRSQRFPRQIGERTWRPLDGPRAFGELDPVGGAIGRSFLIGSDLLDHAAQSVCYGCRGGHVVNASALSKRSVMFTALLAQRAGDALAPHG
jgi:hypothetical protein